MEEGERAMNGEWWSDERMGLTRDSRKRQGSWPKGKDTFKQFYPNAFISPTSLCFTALFTRCGTYSALDLYVPSCLKLLAQPVM